ncbi:MAG: Cu/Ag efflux pump CusA [Gammaproteobacteria bacterium]|jgi:Cu/Ag efflux pump CusA
MHRAGGLIGVSTRCVNACLYLSLLFIPLIESVVRLRYPVIALGVLTLAVAVSAILDNTVRWRFFVAPERGTVTANIAMLPGATRGDTLAMLRSLDSALDRVAKRYGAKYGRHPVELAIAKVGGTTGRGLAGAYTLFRYRCSPSLA